MRKVITFLLVMCCMTVARAQSVTGYAPVANGGKLYYEVYGTEGEPLIFLHGHTLDHRMWQPQIEEFVRHFKVYVIDFRGYGKSSKIAESQRVAHADDVISFMDYMNLPKAHVVGLSMGGFVAGDMVGMFPERMLTCVMSSGALRSKHPSVREPIVAAPDWKSVDNVSEWKRNWIEQLINGGGSRRETIRRSITEQIMEWDGWTLANHEPNLYYGHEAMDSLKARQPDVPTLYISGEMEHKKRNGMLNYLPLSEQKEVPDCGHMSNMEQPEMWNRYVLDFLLKYTEK